MCDINQLWSVNHAIEVGRRLVPFRHLLEARSIDIVMIDLVRVGGITQWMKVAGMAEAFNLPVVIRAGFARARTRARAHSKPRMAARSTQSKPETRPPRWRARKRSIAR